MQNLTAECNFKKPVATTRLHTSFITLHLDVVLRDRFVRALRDADIRQRLFPEHDKYFKTTYYIGVRVEGVVKESGQGCSKTLSFTVTSSKPGPCPVAGKRPPPAATPRSTLLPVRRRFARVVGLAFRLIDFQIS